ncbi:MAG: DEAD/DEAH box helicase [Oscillospiraceae bacterium]|nr:DEAD/DEAH box helicase [Oscillospiraceae bacterium]
MEITEQLIKKSCSSTIYKHGMEYFREGRVHLRKREDKLITAVVDGDELYNVQIKFDGDGISDFFCTCPYYEKMNTMCKHIVATLKQQQTDIEEGAGFVDENDRLARLLCDEFAMKNTETNLLHVKFILYVGSSSGAPSCGMSLEIGDTGTTLRGIENFFDSYIKGHEFLIDRSLSYVPGVTKFSEYTDKIISILAETYENRSTEVMFYTKAAYQTSFGAQTMRRILPLLTHVDFSLVFDGMTLGAVQIKEENPDIIVDVDALDSEISLSVGDRGFALVPDGEWFLYEEVIYHTDDEWRGYYMPIYRALADESRTQISFRGDNTVLFATYVLPNIKDRHGIITRGIEDVVVNETPTFDVYFDTLQNGITAVVVANYGSISLRLPDEKNSDNSRDKIVVRNFEAENNILCNFSGFALYDNIYILYSDAAIYDFLQNNLSKLEEKATLYYSDRFKSLLTPEKADIRTTVGYNEKINLLEADFETDLSYEQICGILSAVKTKRNFYRLSNGKFLDLEDDESRRAFHLLEQLDFTPSELKNQRKHIPAYHALYLDALGYVGKTEDFNDYIEKMKNTEPKISNELREVLRPYQRDGVRWMCQLSRFGFGGILADDMGLGKTLQVIAYVHGEKPDMPVLIVTPSALTYNWLSEINRFTPDATALIIDGTKEERAGLIERIYDYEFIITSYPILRRDINLYRDIEFSYCFIDEAQHIKNAKTMNARSVKKINAKRKFALTGTPIENSLIELWSIFDFVMSGYLYDAREFRSRYEYPMIKEGDNESAAELKARIKPFILRRMKSEVLNELPEKIENTIYADLNSDQKRMYSAYLAMAKDRTIALLSEGGRGKMQILTLLMRLRQICCHPALFDENYLGDSGKLELLMEIIESAVGSGHRVLVFSQFTSMLSIICGELNSRKIPVFYLDGHTPSYERTELAERFNGGERDVFLISLKAGGTGLNLTGADMVVHYDPWWNPAVTDQASDRAYRIGQTRAVQVIRLAARGTIEEKILKLQEAKRSLADDIVKSNNDAFGSLSNEEILALFED